MINTKKKETRATEYCDDSKNEAHEVSTNQLEEDHAIKGKDISTFSHFQPNKHEYNVKLSWNSNLKWQTF